MRRRIKRNELTGKNRRLGIRITRVDIRHHHMGKNRTVFWPSNWRSYFFGVWLVYVLYKLMF